MELIPSSPWDLENGLRTIMNGVPLVKVWIQYTKRYILGENNIEKWVKTNCFKNSKLIKKEALKTTT